MSNIQTNDVVVVHLFSGEDVIGLFGGTWALDDSDISGIIVHKPHHLMAQPTQQGMGIGFVPYGSVMGMLAGAETIEPPDSLIGIVQPAPEEMARKFRERISGIALATQMPRPQGLVTGA